MYKFSHIYVEEEIRTHPNTELILKKFPSAIRVSIQNYKNIFNPSNQNFQVQKAAMKLILAKKKDQFLYKGSSYVSSYNSNIFYYNSLILNCSYNCEYCYLQGMYNSGNVVIFVNEEDFFYETDEFLKTSPLYLCISYDTDLLAFENIVPYTSRWIEFARNKKGKI
jgi:spore photoproduct lyase